MKSIVISLFFAILGMIFSILFQFMAYWGSNTMIWYWIGAVMAYLFTTISFITLILLYRGTKQYTASLKFLILLNIAIILGTIFWTTFIIIAWKSGI
ncbi:hypothetical protein COA08_19165 [Bacillus cereus]|uniref:Group-specific protein n=1 Tax=Bacillus cereus TaxID=1396 RepID=A0A2C0EKQ0_BACCE|nr:DUF3902 family protein [Bacillus cereus]PGQ07025.1 hypothetical protein COA08_19165 [Bacillus cereus]